MKRIALTALTLFMIAGGLILFVLGVRGFLAAVPADAGVSLQDVGRYTPPILWIGVVAALGLSLITFRKHL